MDEEIFGMELAGAVPRLISYLIDGLILMVVFGILFAAIGLPESDSMFTLGSLLPVLIGIGYYTYFFGNGQTFGMKVMKIKLIGTDSTYPVGYGKGFLRWIGMEISGIVLALGYIWILIDKKNQGWHDKIAGTYVVKE